MYPFVYAEESGCDMSCCVSSLVELMADPHYRSISGFESLIQKEWVALGHSFTTRHNLTTAPAAEEDQQMVSHPSHRNCVEWSLGLVVTLTEPLCKGHLLVPPTVDTTRECPS